MAKYKPKVGKTRWRQVITDTQLRSRAMMVELNRLLEVANTAETRNSIYRVIVLTQANELALAELLTMEG
jgi:hypothetical protein